MTAEVIIPEARRVLTPEERMLTVAERLVGYKNPEDPVKRPGAENAMRLDSGLNCSGFIRYCADRAFHLPELFYMSSDKKRPERRKARHLAEFMARPFVPVPWEERRPGLMIFFKEPPYDRDRRFFPEHGGIYAEGADGQDRIIHSQGILAGQQVVDQNLFDVMPPAELHPDIGRIIQLRAVPAEFGRQIHLTNPSC